MFKIHNIKILIFCVCMPLCVCVCVCVYEEGIHKGKTPKAQKSHNVALPQKISC